MSPAHNASPPDLTVIMVSYNTRELTLTALETLFANAGPIAMEVILWDNASGDGSADAIAAAFPDVILVRSPDNLGFAAANNAAAKMASADWLLLLNPDTETHTRAIRNLYDFALANPQAGIVGGRTVFPDGALNPASCWSRISLWSLFCSAFGLTAAFPKSGIFNPESFGGWKRDTVREVDIVSGCFLMVPRQLWNELGGFRDKYFMYGEEADLCLRAHKLGYQPMITPDAQIMHLVGASTNLRSDKLVSLQRARATLIRDHWPQWKVPLGLAMMWQWAVNRSLFYRLSGLFGRGSAGRGIWDNVWRERSTWLGGYRSRSG